ncbi:hypothetical protein ACMUMQ_09255 [Marinomonas sp. 2405UD66-6]|uniref:hypothetical protein n=1 Tax=Marinomonas sp. 2405UD66-6 TaxID=3391834 RepID=UPI0039C918E3
MTACWTSGCINDAVNRLKVPIAITAIIFPAVALIASSHRSAQTAAQIERTDKQIAVTEAKNAFENNIKHRELFFSYLEEQEKVLGVRFTEKQSLYEVIFRENDFIRFTYYADEMALNKELVLMNDEKEFYDFQNHFHYIYFTLSNCSKCWNRFTGCENMKFFYLAQSLYTGWILSGISIIELKSGRSIFDYNCCYVTGRFQNHFYLMLSVLDALEKFCLSESFRGKQDSLYRIEEAKFIEESSNFSQCLYTEKRRVRPILDENGVASGYEEVPESEDLTPF